jgi:hypothetical protein
MFLAGAKQSEVSEGRRDTLSVQVGFVMTSLPVDLTVNSEGFTVLLVLLLYLS